MKPDLSPQEALRGAILAEAASERDRILLMARQEAEAILAKAGAEAEKARGARLDSARAEAGRLRELIPAAVALEAGRLRSARIGAVLESIREEAVRRLRSAGSDSERGETLSRLAAAAVSRMAGDHFLIKLSPADRPAGNALAGEVALRAARPAASLTIAEDPALAAGGVVVQDGEGRQVWDNSPLSRLERLWPEMRRRLAVSSGLVPAGKPAGGGK
jgi:vacuolar-type H+-ATPase subunit E/Vma4